MCSIYHTGVYIICGIALVVSVFVITIQLGAVVVNQPKVQQDMVRGLEDHTQVVMTAINEIVAV